MYSQKQVIFPELPFKKFFLYILEGKYLFISQIL